VPLDGGLEAAEPATVRAWLVAAALRMDGQNDEGPAIRRAFERER
jgi:hypothetical protein